MTRLYRFQVPHGEAPNLPGVDFSRVGVDAYHIRREGYVEVNLGDLTPTQAQGVLGKFVPIFHGF